MTLKYKIMRTTILLVLFLSMNLTHISSQMYNTIGGIRLGDDFGLTVSQRIANKTTLDAIYQSGTFAGNEMISLTARQHYPLLTKRFNFFLGGGAAHRITHNSFADAPASKIHNTHLAFTIGAEMTLGHLNISADYMPMVSISNYSSRQRFYANSGISLKYVFIKKTKNKEKFINRINIFKKKK